ncbi:MAG TPA: MoaD/ThiS family protein [Cyclobacteriaceae bacterium]|jgi:molybdopterin converting factor small subunit|nr:MoaD/ThiS family protein [Cyclobacteriaceae bacterium]
MATIIIPTPLRRFTNNVARMNVGAGNVSDAVLELTSSFPELKKHLIDTNGKIAPFINIFVDNSDIRSLDREQTQVKENAVIFIIPAIAGGITSPKK